MLRFPKVSRSLPSGFETMSYERWEALTIVKQIRWGILGTASIALRQAIPAINAAESGAVTAIASRNLERATQVAEELGIPNAYGSYEALIESEDVDAVYVPLPNDLHLPWIKRAARAGKHVLSEKPLGLNADEVRQVIAIAEETGRFIMEGVASHFHPIHHRAAERIREGAVGDPRFVRVSLGWSFEGRRDDYRWQKRHGGGGLLDIGGYCVYAARLVIGAEPEYVVSRANFDPESGVDTNVAIMLGFPGGVNALIDCGILSASRNCYEIIGSAGKIVVDSAFGNRNQQRKISLFDVHGGLKDEELVVAQQFELQFEAVSRHILEGKAPPLPLSESLANAQVVDACMESAQNGGTPVRLH